MGLAAHQVRPHYDLSNQRDRILSADEIRELHITTSKQSSICGVTIPAFSAARQFAWGMLSARIETCFHSLGLGYEYGSFLLLLQADAIDQDRAKSQAVPLRYSRSFKSV
jgi:hypothetical protein